VSAPLVILFSLTVVGAGGWWATQTFGLPPELAERIPGLATREPRAIETPTPPPTQVALPLGAADAAQAELPDASGASEQLAGAEADAGTIATTHTEDAGSVAVAPAVDAGGAIASAAEADAGAAHAEAPHADEAAQPTTPARKGGSGVAVVIKSVPDAIVWIEGNSAGATPLKIDLAAGSYKLRFDSPDAGLNKSILLRVPAGETFEREFTFERAKLTLEAPEGATVFLGRRKLGKAPVAPVEVYEGTYRVHVVDEKKSLDVTKFVDVKPGDVTARVGME
jgi:hypothetical protein